MEPTDHDESSKSTLRAFWSEELNQRRASISSLATTIDNDDRIAILATGLYWSWLITHADSLEDRTYELWCAAAAPALLTLLFGLRWYLLQTWINTHAEYARQLERACLSPPTSESSSGACPLGWERFLVGTDGRSEIPDFPTWHYGFWGGLLAFNLVVGVVMGLR